MVPNGPIKNPPIRQSVNPPIRQSANPSIRQSVNSLFLDLDFRADREHIVDLEYVAVFD
jgi:hypothetical protein